MEETVGDSVWIGTEERRPQSVFDRLLDITQQTSDIQQKTSRMFSRVCFRKRKSFYLFRGSAT